MDRYLVHGNDYKAVRDAVAKAILESKPLAVETALEVGQADGCSVYTVSPHSPSLVLLGSNEAMEEAPQGDRLPWKSYVHGLVSSPGNRRVAGVDWVAGFVRANQQLLSDSFRSIIFFETLLKSRFLQDSSALRCGGTGSKTS